ncbi:MAG TPA: hypothetical protein VGM09_21815 [Bradyrhizobium sp.]
MQTAINGHLSQSTGVDLSGQQGISSNVASPDIAIPSDIVIAGVADPALAATGAENGAVARPAIKRIASSRQKVNDRITTTNSHSRTQMKSSAAITNSPESWNDPMQWRKLFDHPAPRSGMEPTNPRPGFSSALEILGQFGPVSYADRNPAGACRIHPGGT